MVVAFEQMDQRYPLIEQMLTDTQVAVPADERTPEQWITRLWKRLDERTKRIQLFDDYYAGKQRLRFTTLKMRETFGNEFGSFADNFCLLVVDAIEERLKVTGFRVLTDDGKPETPTEEAAESPAEESAEQDEGRAEHHQRRGVAHLAGQRHGGQLVAGAPGGTGGRRGLRHRLGRPRRSGHAPDDRGVTIRGHLRRPARVIEAPRRAEALGR